MEDKLFENLPKNVIDNVFSEFDSYRIISNYVFHYTSLESFYNILKSGTIWFSNIQELNDPNEVNFGINTILTYIVKKQTIRNRLRKIYREQKEREFHNLGNIESNIFIFSTSTIPDNYQQWMNYGDVGNGVCIGFDRGGVFEAMKLKLQGKKFIYTYPIQYYDKENNISENEIAKFGDTINICFETLFKQKLTMSQEYEIYKLLAIFASIIKDKFHKEEREIRYLILYPFKNLCLPQELLDRNNIDIICRNKKLAVITKLAFYQNISYMDETTDIANRSADFGIIKKIILGPRNTNDLLLYNNITYLIRKYNAYFDVSRICFSEGILR